MGGEDDERSCCVKFSQGCSNFGNFLYRKEKNKDGKFVGLVIGRSCGSWARIGLFYLGFYGFLAGFFAAMLIVFLSTINPATEIGLDPETAGPKLVQFLADGDLAVAPGLNLVNSLPSIAKLIKEEKFTGTEDDKKTKAENKRRADFLNVTQTYINKFDYTTKCPSGEDGNKKDVPCQPNLNATAVGGLCEESTAYGYDDQKPCFFIKINKVWGWIPMADGSDYLKLVCTASDLAEAKVLNVGFQKSAFPFFGQKGYQTPPAIVQVDISKAELTGETEVKCKLEGKGVSPSDSYNPSRSFGTIKLQVPKLKL